MASKYVSAYLRLESSAESAEAKVEEYRARAEENRWEQCRIAHEAITSGEFNRKDFGAEVGKSGTTIGVQFKMWEQWGAIKSALSRPPYGEAYSSVTSDGSPEVGWARKDKSAAKKALADPVLGAELIAEAVKSNPALLDNVAPSAIAKQAAKPNVARAIARNDAAREAVEDEAIEVRATQRAEPTFDKNLPKKVGASMNKALKIDEATTLLHKACGLVAEAILAKDEYGIDYPEAEAEALKKLRRYINIYVNDGEVNDDDREWLAGIGVTL